MAHNGAVSIAPSILSADFGRLADEVAAVTAAGADCIHVDVMDGHFVPNLTIGPVVVAALRKATSLPLDVHLMIAEPDRYIEAFAEAGADTISVHAETAPHLHRTVTAIRALGKRPSVALNPATSLEAIRHVLDELDQVLLMTVNPGFGGQRFIPSMVPKIRALAQEVSARGLSCRIEVDGGINGETVAQVVAAGARVLVAGTAVYGAPDYRVAITELRRKGNEAIASLERPAG